ncbi:MAG: hypothetical protein HYZ73_03025 [Elusimicrobia bacterium]|nr:hypothetical protein [Elusimicrobiota bacterium]
MDMLNTPLGLLLALQEHDLQIEGVAAQLRQLPEQIEGGKRQIEQGRVDLEQVRKATTQLQMARKEKELELQTKEDLIRKHTTELNSVKSNEAYRALCGEIDRAKAEKSVLEDALLALFDQIDRQQAILKQEEQHWKGREAELLKQIQAWQAEQEQRTQELKQLEEVRAARTQGIAASALSQYERIHAGIRGPAIVAIKGEICSGCHMRLPPHLINEVKRDQALVFCNICARILYLPESRVAADRGEPGVVAE